MQDYIVVSPKYLQASNGIRTLHKICHGLNQHGARARMVFIEDNAPECQTLVLRDASWTNPEWNTPPLEQVTQELLENAYVIYPEVIVGNPLRMKKVIRYFGNREGYCNRMMIGIQPTDFLLAHSRVLRQDAHCILFNSEIPALFNNKDTVPTLHRSVDITYVGKGQYYGEVGLIQNTVLISRDYPPQKEQLASLLRGTRIFYTWDSWTQLNVEAILCGAIPCFMRYEPWTEADLDGCEIGPIPRVDYTNQHVDIEKFNAGRLQLIEKISALSATWDERLQNFMQKVEDYFGQHGRAAMPTTLKG